MPDWLFALISLTAMEIVLGIDNIIFLTILVGRLPAHQQTIARQLGLGAALASRLLLLFALAWLASMTTPIFSWTDIGIPGSWLRPELKEVVDERDKNLMNKDIHGTEVALTPAMAEAIFEQRNQVSLRDIVLIIGGLFLIVKSTMEISHKLEEARRGEEHAPPRVSGFMSVIVQIAIIDIIFSLDSVITAVGMAKQVWVMVVAMVTAVVVMLLAAAPIGNFVSRHPTMKMLALSFLILIGVMLLADGFGQHIDRGYIYFAMGFSVLVELLNLKLRKS
ncbi:MAG: TerC family protein [Planctomycetia bacterium]|nr:TerC family protein [Planctomycetia bacterium]